MTLVFISYQRAAEAEAGAVNQKLKEAGFEVWQDVQNIRHTARWPIAINTALNKAERIVLLLTPASMSSDEVFNEWFFFYTERKPIHCLMLETCKPHYQLNPFQWLDWRQADKREWNRLFKELQAPFEWPSVALAEKVINSPFAPTRTLPEAFEALLQAVRSESGVVALNDTQVDEIRKHHPADLTEYRLGRIAEWSQPRYQLDNRFVQLSLLIDQGEEAQGPRWTETKRFNDLREVLAEIHDPALVVLGAPGSGKSTLLRRLELDLAVDRLRDEGQQLTFFIQLNEYRGSSPNTPLPSPLEWLAARWSARYPDLPKLPELLRQGRMLLLLDAVNEMPHVDNRDYRERISLWKHFLLEAIRDNPGNQVIFSCRSLDYSAPLSSPDLRVPQIRIEPMDDQRIQDFLGVYLPAQAAMVWKELDGSPQLDLFRTPYFLKLLLDQVEQHQKIPNGRAGLFTGFVRQALWREVHTENPLFMPDTLLTERDFKRVTQASWQHDYDLPERGALIGHLSQLAFKMQDERLKAEGAQIKIKIDHACELLSHDRDEDIIRAGVDLNVLDENSEDVMFFHQLLQEFFAARQLAIHANPEKVKVEWRAALVKPSLTDQLAALGDSDPLPPLPATGWEETTVMAAAMSTEPDGFVRDLMATNLPLAARCAASPEIKIAAALKSDIQQALIARTEDSTTDLRARIAAGLALGNLGDPRFERHTGSHGDYLLPLLVTISGGEYPIGSTDYDDEKPPHRIKLDAFQIGKFPVTNAEYALFIVSNGYEDEQWWHTEAAKAWRRGEGSNEGPKQQWRDNRKTIQGWTEEYIRSLVRQNRITSKQADDYAVIRNWSEPEFEAQLDEWYPAGRQTLPDKWKDELFNNPAQPLVGVCWYEAQAYCAWLSTQTGQPYRLPTEVEYEAAASGQQGRQFAYGEAFDPSRGNTFETHLRGTAPIGVFPDGKTPEGAVDLCGNTYDWTSSAYLPYPYQASDGREDVNRTDVRRVVRGGSWNYDGAPV